MNSSAQATGRIGVTSAEKISADSRHRIGRTRFPPARAFWLGFFLGFGIEWLRGQLAASLLKQNFHFALGLFQVFLAIARELHAFLEQFHGLVERKVRALQLLHDFFQTRQRMLEIGLLRGIWFFRRCRIHWCHFSLSLALGAKVNRPPILLNSPKLYSHGLQAQPAPSIGLGNRERDEGSILMHAREPRQPLYVAGGLTALKGSARPLGIGQRVPARLWPGWQGLLESGRRGIS